MTPSPFVLVHQGNRTAPEVTLTLSIDRAIAAVSGAAQFAEEISYSLDKHIPIGAGLGGGSADAAAAMRATCRLIAMARGMSTPMDHSAGSHFPDLGLDLNPIAASLGSDVPFFLVGGTVLVEGRGERITPLADAIPIWILLASDGSPVSTRMVFEAFVDGDRGDGRATERVLEEIAFNRLTFGGNDLTAPALRRYPFIRRTLQALDGVVPPERVAMSGSGGTIVALCASRDESEVALSRVREKVPWTAIARSVTAAETHEGGIE